MASIEVKIKKLDGELARYKEQMSKLRNGPGKVCSHIHYVPSPSYADPILTYIHALERNPRTCAPNIEAETNV